MAECACEKQVQFTIGRIACRILFTSPVSVLLRALTTGRAQRGVRAAQFVRLAYHKPLGDT